ncbi:MAG: UDP-3-O-(3-hydroxymyristoyl)glucosamine N-acyltransferase [Lentimicrobiaceae bacterium]|nr:UDP-3-O-(3-hydroxymyristoyl)glucosamine N-acyltransferase [Lentimicrobiaceae bacterium]
MMNKEFTARQISEILNGKLEGNEQVKVSKLAKIDGDEQGGLVFVSDSKYEKYLYTTQAAIAIVKESLQIEGVVKPTLIRVKNPQFAFVKILQFYASMKKEKTGISKQAFVSKTAKIGRDVYIGEGVVIGKNAVIGDDVNIYPQAFVGDGVQIGEGTVLYAGVKVYEDCVVGNECMLHAGCVIGADGFGFMPNEKGVYEKIPQLGNVVIGDNVEIGANTCIDRSTVGSTLIGNGVKIDNLVQIAHNCIIGENTVIAACCGIAGSVKIGKNCVLGGQVGVKDHVTIGNYVIAGSQCGIHKNIPDKQTVLGSPAMEGKKMLKIFAALNFLPDMVSKMR